MSSRRGAVAPAIPAEVPAPPERPQLLVRRVTDPDDPDLPAAYDVYTSGITNPAERDSFPEIQRWLAEARAAGTARLDEYLLVARVRTKVCGFFYGQYYPSHRMFLIGYLVIDRKSTDARRATSSGIIRFMFDLLRREHPQCEGIVFELALDPGKDPKARVPKEELFAVHARAAAHVVVKRLDIEYVQPKLSLREPGLKEEQQHLMYGRMKGKPLGTTLSKQEARHVLDAVYNCWYADYYVEDPASDAEYRPYVRRVFERAVAKLPDPVALR